jgi:GTP-binding protein HflX
MAVLTELGANEKPSITVLNKIDLIEDQTLLRSMPQNYPESVLISASSGKNLPSLIEMIQERFQDAIVTLKLKIPHTRMDLVSQFYKVGKVVDIQYQQKSIKIVLNLPKVLKDKLLRDKDIIVGPGPNC